jgi:protein-tyrosine kinase
LSNAFGKSASLLEKGNLILVTSSIPGEGKTHTAINLALSMAHEQDHTVLLIDCDVTRCGTSRMLGIHDKPGLVEILENNDFSVSDAILRTDVPALSLISAGKQHDFVTELLASQRMFEFVSEICKRYDDRVVIFDGPPLIPTPQTQVLTGLVGQVVFVIEAGKTPQSVVEEAMNMISKDQSIGLVMNKSEGISARSSYYYGYYDEHKKTDSK